MEGEGGVEIMRRNAEIDTSAQFRSVKEAVLLYGEQLLANKIQQMHEKSSARDEQEKVELLEETKESLQKAREDGVVMASCISSLQKELERTRRELQHLKQLEKSSSSSDITSKQVRIIENLKFNEDATKFDHELMKDIDEVVKNKVEFHKRYVTSGSHPTPFGRVMVPPPPNYSDHHAAVLQRHPSLRKKKKKSLIPFIGGIFSRKKGSSSEMV